MKKSHSISFNLILYTILIYLVFVLGIVISASSIYMTSISEVTNQRVSESSKQIVNNYETYFENTIEVSNSIQDKILNNDVDQEKNAIQSYFDDVKNMKREILNISLYDANNYGSDGSLLVGDSTITNTENSKNEPRFTEAYNNQLINMFSGVHRQSESMTAYSFTLSRYINYARETRHAILKVDFDFTKIVTQIAQTNLGEDGHVVIYNKDYEIIYISTPDFISLDIENLKNLVLGTTTAGLNGHNFNLFISSLNSTGWRVGVFTNIDEFNNILTRFLAITICVTIFAIIVFTLIIIYLVRRIVDPLQKLTREMSKVSDLNYTLSKSAIIRGPKEVEDLDKSFIQLMGRIRDLANNLIKEKEAQRSSELKALQNQINPHFLYNTLDSIIYMIDQNENDKAEEMIVALSKFFRISISRGKNIIPLKDEIEHVRNYLLIQKIRFGDNFSYIINVDENLYKYKVIKLTLQPLVENSIEHGLKDNNEGKININGYLKGDFIRLEIIDNGFGMTSKQIESIYESFHDDKIHNGVGLKNVYQRIKIFYGDLANVTIESQEDEGTKITIYIPISEALKDEKD